MKIGPSRRLRVQPPDAIKAVLEVPKDEDGSGKAAAIITYTMGVAFNGKGFIRRKFGRSLANAEKTLGFFDGGRVAEELKGDSAVTLFQDDPQEAEIVSFESAANVVFCLPEHVSFKKPRPEIRFEMNHGGFQ